MGKEILSAVPNRRGAALAMCDKIDWKDHEICILIAGVDSTPDEVEDIKNHIEKTQSVEVYCIEGKQDIYSYILIVE